MPGPNAATVTKNCGEWCYATITKTSDKVGCVTSTVTSTKTSTPTVIITAAPTRTVTVSACVATKTICANKWKKDEIPDELTNAERMQYGLPPRSPGQKRKRTFWIDFNTGPSCTPTTVISTGTVTKTVPGTVTVSSTSCYLTSTKTAYNTKFTTYTATCWSTVKGAAVTKTTSCATATSE